MHGVGTRVAAVVVPPSRLVVFAGGASLARTATGEPTFVVLNVLGRGGYALRCSLCLDSSSCR